MEPGPTASDPDVVLLIVLFCSFYGVTPGSPRLLRVREERGIALRSARSPPFRRCSDWPQFCAAMLALYLSINVVFATLYLLVPGSVANARPGSFADVFFFSIETLATVGYGEMSPAMLYSHVAVALEIVCGFAFTAILTGLTFMRFSRPRAKLVFAANPVVVGHRTKPTLMVRIGNGRGGVLQGRGGEAEHLPYRHHRGGYAPAAKPGVGARTRAPPYFYNLLDTHACA
jgi:hypothetical protein